MTFQDKIHDACILLNLPVVSGKDDSEQLLNMWKTFIKPDMISEVSLDYLKLIMESDNQTVILDDFDKVLDFILHFYIDGSCNIARLPNGTKSLTIEGFNEIPIKATIFHNSSDWELYVDGELIDDVDKNIYVLMDFLLTGCNPASSSYELLV